MKLASLFTLWDVLISLLPSALSTFIALKILDENSIGALMIGFTILLALIATLLFSNQKKRRRAISEIIAIGYFMNFIEQLVENLALQTPVYFDGEKDPRNFSMNDITIRVFMPKSTEALTSIASKLNNPNDYSVVHIKNQKNGTPIWARAPKSSKNSIVLVDFPRTLFSLPDYIKKDMGGKYSKKDSMRLYRVFNEKIKELIDVPNKDVMGKVKIEEYP